MTDFTTPTTIASRRILVSGVKVPLPVIPRATVALLTVFGKAFASIPAAYRQAVYLAYSAPFSQPTQPQRFSSDEDLEGRDPNW